MAKSPDFFFKLAVKFEFNAENRKKMYIKLAQLMGNGVSLNVALQQVERLGSKNKGSALPRLYQRWRHEVTNGTNFGECIRPYVPPTEAMLIETGANSGFLAKAMLDAADAVDQQGRVTKAIVSNGSYPALLMLVLVAALYVSAYEVIPTFEQVLPIEDWVGVAYLVAKASVFIRDWGILIILLLGGIIFLIGYSFPRWITRSRISLDYTFPWNIYRMWQGSAFLLSIAALMSAGVKLDEVSLQKITKNANPYLAQRVRAIKKYIVSGDNLGDALYKCGYRFPDDDLIADLRVFATLKGFEQNLIRITKEWVEDIENQVAIVMKVVNFATLISIAVTIGLLITSLFNVVQQIQSAAQL